MKKVNKWSILSLIAMFLNNAIWLLCILKKEWVYKFIRWIPNGVPNTLLSSINTTRMANVSMFQTFSIVFLFWAAFMMIPSTILILISVFKCNLKYLQNSIWTNVCSIGLIFVSWPTVGNRFCFLSIFMLFSAIFAAIGVGNTEGLTHNNCDE